MDKQELIEFLKDHLKIELEIEDDDRFLTAKILLGDETITETSEQISY